MTIAIRDATFADRPVIADFNTRLAAESEDYALDPQRIGRGVAAVLADPAKGRYWLAEVDGKVVGQVMVTYEWSDWRNGVIWWIQSVYVQPDYRRAGVFSSLFRHVELRSRESTDVCGLRLYVEQDNVHAQEVYSSLGLRLTSYRVMQNLFSEKGDDNDA